MSSGVYVTGSRYVRGRWCVLPVGTVGGKSLCRMASCTLALLDWFKFVRVPVAAF